MKNFKVETSKDLETKGKKPFKALEIVDEQGNKNKVNIFNNFPNFANITVGSVILGELKTEGEYTNLVSAEQSAKPNAGAYKQKVIEETMQRKETSIGKFQDNKEWSIKVASTMSGAVALAVAEYKDKTVLDSLDEAVLKWRKFLLDNWDVDYKETPPWPQN